MGVLSAGFCPVACRIIHLDSDHKGVVRIRLTVHDAGLRVEIAADRPNRKRLIWLPNFLRHNSGTMATYVDCGREFEGWIIRIIKIHKHLHGNTHFLSAQRGHLFQGCSFGPGDSHTSKPTFVVLGSNGTGGQRPVGRSAHIHSPENPTKVEWRREVSSDGRKGIRRR